MNLGNLIKQLTQIKLHTVPASAKPKDDTFVGFESTIAQTLLDQTIRILSSKDASKEVAQSDIDLVSRLLATRWEHIKATDASYFANPYGTINAIYIQVAKTLACINGRPWLAYLIPTLSPEAMIAHSNDSLKFYHYIPNKACDTLINLQTAYQREASSQAEKLGVTFRVAHAVPSGSHGKSSRKKPTKESLSSEVRVIGFSYNEAGDQHLRVAVYKNADHLFETKEALFDAFGSLLTDRQEWLNILNAMSKAKLTALLLDNGQKTLDQAINEMKIEHDDGYHHAMLFAYTTLFIANRKEGWEYGNPLLAPAGVVGMVYGKAAKVESAEMLQSYLLNGRKIADFQTFFNTLDEAKKGPLKNGVLSRLTQKFAITPAPSPELAQSKVMHL